MYLTHSRLALVVALTGIRRKGGSQVGILFAAILIGLIPASIAKGKGRSFFGWWLYGSAIFIVALPHALLAKPVEGAGVRKCPHCAELIKDEAKVCRFCGRDVA